MKTKSEKGKEKITEEKTYPRRKFNYIEAGKPRTIERRRGNRNPSRESSVESFSDEPNIGFRGLLDDEDIKQGLKSKDPSKNMTPLGHVSATRNKTPYISASRSIKPAAHFGVSSKEEGRKPGKIAKIDLNNLEYYDLTNEDTFNEQGFNRNRLAGDSALKAQEILVKGIIPAENILGYYDVKPGLTKEQYEELKRNETATHFGRKFFYNHIQEGARVKHYPTRYEFTYHPINEQPTPLTAENLALLNQSDLPGPSRRDNSPTPSGPSMRKRARSPSSNSSNSISSNASKRVDLLGLIDDQNRKEAPKTQPIHLQQPIFGQTAATSIKTPFRRGYYIETPAWLGPNPTKAELYKYGKIIKDPYY